MRSYTESIQPVYVLSQVEWRSITGEAARPVGLHEQFQCSVAEDGEGAIHARGAATTTGDDTAGGAVSRAAV